MKFTIGKKYIGLNNEIEISEQEYCDLEMARNILIYAQSFEEKYDLIISNYIELEQEVLNLALENMVYYFESYTFIPSVIRQVNRRLINLLTSIKLYQDQIKQNIPDGPLKECLEKDQIKKLFSQEWDSNINYRFMDALRNYVQHCGLPIRWVSAGGKWTSTDDDGILEHYVQIFARREILEFDPKFKRSVLKDMQEKIDLQRSTRSYMESISNVHITARLLLDGDVEASRKNIIDAQEIYTQKYNDDLTSLNAYKIKDDKIVNSIPLLLNWDDIRLELVNKNNKLTNLSKRRLVSIAPE